jgi:thiosulfate reductase cytochrome b subunit
MSEPQPLYELHERIWHWLQAAALLALLLTGFAIHYPDHFGILGSLSRAVSWHSWLGLFLILNAFLGLFYHFTAQRFHHYLPALDDFTSGAVRQLRFYLVGIFKKESHPFETDPRRKLNPLQKLTYLGLLNVALPFQLLTGALLWGADFWPETFDGLGGLRLLAPAHTLGAYLFLAFLVAHVYLTTTGRTPASLLVAMITGREGSAPADQVRVQEPPIPPGQNEGPPEEGLPAQGEREEELDSK